MEGAGVGVANGWLMIRDYRKRGGERWGNESRERERYWKQERNGAEKSVRYGKREERERERERAHG